MIDEQEAKRERATAKIKQWQYIAIVIGVIAFILFLVILSRRSIIIDRNIIYYIGLPAIIVITIWFFATRRKYKDVDEVIKYIAEKQKALYGLNLNRKNARAWAVSDIKLKVYFPNYGGITFGYDRMLDIIEDKETITLPKKKAELEKSDLIKRAPTESEKRFIEDELDKKGIIKHRGD